MNENTSQAQFYRNPGQFDNYMGAFQFLKWSLYKDTDLNYGDDLMQDLSSLREEVK